jgi:molybdopterin converting factor small subunit
MKLQLSGTLKRFAGYNDTLEVEGRTVRAALQHLATVHPALKPVLFDGEGQVRQLHRLFLNAELLRTTQLDDEVDERDTLEIVTAIAGG